MHALASHAPERSPHSAGWSLFIRVATFVFVNSALIVTVLTGISYVVARTIIRQQVEQRLNLAATQRAQAIEMYVEQQHERVRLVASRTRLRERMRDWSRDELPTELFRTEVQKILVDAIAGSEEFLEISIADPGGLIVAGTNAARIGTSVTDNPAYRVGKERPFLSDFSMAGGQFLTTLSAPAWDDHQQLLGVVIVTLHSSTLTRIVTDLTGMGQSGEVLIGRRDGAQHVHYLLPSHLTGKTEVAAGDAPAMLKAIAGERGFERAWYDGQDVLIVYQPVGYQPNYQPWGVVVKLTAAEAFTPLMNLRRMLMPLGLLLLVPAIGSAYWLASKYARPIMHLADSAAIFAEGNLRHRVPAHYDGEIAVLSRALNDMAEHLEASYEVLENRVAERTAELSTANRELERSNRDLEQFAYVASHDMQEPLRAITGFARMLRDHQADALSSSGREYLDFILEGADRMKLLIDNLLEYSRVRSQGLLPTEVDSGAVLSDALKNLTSVLEARQAVVTHDGLGQVMADRSQLTQLFQNLIGNALKFCDHPVPRVHVHGEEGAEEWLFAISDNGIGIDPKNYQRIFAIFQRLHAREAYAGTGLGLAICQQIVQRHGGRIWVESKLGEGSTFFFTLRRPPRTA